MELDNLLARYTDDSRTARIVSSFQIVSKARQHLSGLIGSQEAFVAAGTYLAAPQCHLFILENKDEAAYFQNDLAMLLPRKDVLFFPDSFKKAGSPEEINKSNVLMRAEMASKILASQTTGELIVTYPEALYEKIVNTRILSKNTIHIKMRENLDVVFLIEVLTTYGFERSDFVYEPGQFSVRGGIIDIYSFGNDLPYRVELFGKEVESIRIFDPLSQLSDRRIQHVTIVPNIQTQFTGHEKTVLSRLLPDNTVVWIKDLDGLLGTCQKCYEKTLEVAEHLQKNQLINDENAWALDAQNTFVGKDELLQNLIDYSIITFGNDNYFNANDVIYYTTSPQPSFNKNFNLLINDWLELERQAVQIYLFAGSTRQINRFDAIFEDLKASRNYTPLVEGLYLGFIDRDLQIACYSDHQIFDRYYKYNIKQGYSKDKAITVKLLRELQPGDYITHINHGVGVYSGLEKIRVGDQWQEAIRLIYKDSDVLYVGINSLHKVSRYVGKEGKPPKLNKLGSDVWESVKRKAKRQIKDIAADLIRLYAKRKATQGHAYMPDTYLQTELEASFIYEDTPDQLRATLDVKKDMESPMPMDRLVCGDVGFGKTEVAVRAAAKAVADSKQVAILVPTTILALQHFKTFSDRLKDFPCKIDYLNRFKTAKEKRETVERLKEGKIDIVIGTHALLAKTVSFKDLGLLIIDEEQKFGVAAKERLRQLRVNVDTLTLTATPIPRTLQFSLMNARDLSLINTPPANRQPIHTELISFDTDRIRDAVNFEVYRGGQVFFVHNRVKDLAEIANIIKGLCPDLDIGVAHGQMDNNTLEDHMKKFIDGKYDVLVSTNIIEAGLDVPNANTIIINNAHNFGLSDLHQLRGRVGRSNRKAFCYLIAPPVYSLPDDSRKRLRSIEQFSELGSGFQIAMRDLDIRGAGDLLGAEQSGFISDIGFDIYQKILKEAIRELKHTDFKDVFQEEINEKADFVADCQVDTDLEMLIPDEYVNNVSERLSLYTRLDNIETENDLLQFQGELLDRFGQLPVQVKELFNAVRLRWAAKQLGFERIILKNRKLRCYFIEDQKSAYYSSPQFAAMIQYVGAHQRKMHFKQSEKNFILVADNIRTITEAEIMLKEMADVVKSDSDKNKK